MGAFQIECPHFTYYLPPILMKRLPHLLFALLFIIYFLCYQGVLSHVIYYHEQHHLFLFSKEYFLKQIHTEGLLSYLTDFIIQFFYMPALGSAILAGILAGIYLLTHYNIKKNNRTTGHTAIIIDPISISFHLYAACGSFTDSDYRSILRASDTWMHSIFHIGNMEKHHTA